MLRPRFLSLLGSAGALGVFAFLVSPAHANLIYDGNAQVKGGVGNSQIVLSLSSPGSSSNEAGSVMPSGCSGDIQNPCKPPSNNTPSLSDAHVTSAQGLVIYLDAQEPGSDNSITLNSLTLNVYAATGTSDTALFSASYIGPPSPLDLTVCPGQGNNCVNAFVLDAIQAANLQTLLNNTTDSSSLRVGLAASFSNATGGPDRLFLANTTDVPVPTPLIGHGLFVFLAISGVLFGSKLWENLKTHRH
jgi:hypothetical protein